MGDTDSDGGGSGCDGDSDDGGNACVRVMVCSTCSGGLSGDTNIALRTTVGG